MINLFVPFEKSDYIRVKALRAFADGLKLEHEICNLFNGYEECDTAVLFGTAKKSSLSGKKNMEVLKSHNGKVVIIELGFIHRHEFMMVGIARPEEKAELKQWIPWGLNGRADFMNQDSPSDRWKQLEINLKPQKQANNNHILICGQKINDASVQHINHNIWINNIINKIVKITDRQVVFRPHPLEDKSKKHKQVKILNKQIRVSNQSFKDDLSNAHCVVSFSSNSCVEALIEGIPVFCFDKGSMVYSICNKSLDSINNPSFPSEKDRKQWAYNLAYTQWNLNEMERGLPQTHLKIQ